MHQALCNIPGSILGARNTENLIARHVDLHSFPTWNLAWGKDSFPFNSTFGLYAWMGSHSLIIWTVAFMLHLGKNPQEPSLPLITSSGRQKSWPESEWLTNPAWLGLRVEIFLVGRTVSLETRTDGFPRWRLSALQSGKPGQTAMSWSPWPVVPHISDRPGLLVLLLLSVAEVCAPLALPAALACPMLAEFGAD